MSISETTGSTEFDAWLAAMLAKHERFTLLVVLVAIDGDTVAPLCSTYFHVVGDEVAWEEIAVMFAGSGQSWSAAAFFATKAEGGGPVDNPTAHRRLRELEQKIIADRMILNEGEFFDTSGRHIRIDPAGGP